MDFIREYWWLILVIVIAIAIAVTLLRPRQRVRLTDSAPIRPHMAARPPEGRGLAGEAAVATSDLTGEFLGAPVRRNLEGGGRPGGDELCQIKGIGPKFEDVLNGLGFTRFDQLARLTPTEVERLDPQLGAFSGRIARDRIVEQADYLARSDIDGFEQRFGKI